jgi:hypothetical protein
MKSWDIVRDNLGDKRVIGIRRRRHFGGCSWLRRQSAVSLRKKMEKNQGQDQALGRRQKSKSHYVYADVNSQQGQPARALPGNAVPTPSKVTNSRRFASEVFEKF